MVIIDLKHDSKLPPSSSFVVVMTNYAAKLGSIHAPQCCPEMPSKLAVKFA